MNALLLVAIILLAIQFSCLLLQVLTKDVRWAMGGVGLMPLVIVLSVVSGVV